MTLTIDFTDGTTKTWSYVDSASLDVQAQVLVVLPERHSNRVIKYPLAHIKSWETDR